MTSMHSILTAIMPISLWALTLIEAAFLFLFAKGYIKTRRTILLLSGLVTIGLVYDGLILALGTVLTEGAWLTALSRLRFVSHGVLVPLFFPVCACALGCGEGIRRAVWALTAAIMILGACEGFATVLETREIAGVVRCASSGATPAWAARVDRLLSYGTVVPLIIAGVWVWIKQKTPCLFLSGFLMFAFAALGPATGNFDLIFFISMFGEMFMVIFLYAYSRRS